MPAIMYRCIDIWWSAGLSNAVLMFPSSLLSLKIIFFYSSSYINNYLLQPLNQNYDQASQTTYVVCINFIKDPPNNFFFENALKNITEYFFKFLFLFESTILPVNNGK